MNRKRRPEEKRLTPGGRRLAYLMAIVTPERLCAVPTVRITGTAAPIGAPGGMVKLICISPANPGAEAA